jgi:hypothetical protein
MLALRSASQPGYADASSSCSNQSSPIALRILELATRIRACRLALSKCW